MKRLSTLCRIFIFFLSIAPGMRIESPGPGNGCLFNKSGLIFSFFPKNLTSSLNNSFRGSTIFKFIFLGRPPTLWWLLIFAVGPPKKGMLSIMSGYNVPCARYSTFLIFLPLFQIL